MATFSLYRSKMPLVKMPIRADKRTGNQTSERAVQIVRARMVQSVIKVVGHLHGAVAPGNVGHLCGDLSGTDEIETEDPLLDRERGVRENASGGAGN